ncbi:MAG: aspartate kinase [Lewinellaceae bacterium]|nr:aspartate kinase [Saprospiraceae bacterium]MCB9311313.1 aspartate kinase [Lewinellaceae bacterium]HRW75019.1 aspartate kinase [Saprospiraceae bacterium]
MAKMFKFGGSSLKDADSVRNVATILQRFKDENLVIVVSAMGKTTNALEEVIYAHARQDGSAASRLQAIQEMHQNVARELLPGDHDVFALLNDTFVEATWVLEEPPHPNFDYMYDQIICVGELASSRIVHAYLQEVGLPTQWLDAREVIITDDIHREGWVNWEETGKRMESKVLPMVSQPGFVLTQGFIGSTLDNASTTLGREGSDYTTAIFTFCLNGESMTIWKDVPGVLTGDPKLFANVTKLDRLSYREAIEMTYYGAKVIHPKTIKPLQNKSIPLYVKSFIDPDGEGTLISSDVEDLYPPIVTIEQQQTLLSISTRDFSFVAEHHLSLLFKMIADLRLQVNIMQNSAISFSICVNHAPEKIDEFIRSVDRDFKVQREDDLELITIRHAQPDLLQNLRKGKIIFLEEHIRDTVQFVVKEVPMMSRKPVHTEP